MPQGAIPVRHQTALLTRPAAQQQQQQQPQQQQQQLQQWAAPAAAFSEPYGGGALSPWGGPGALMAPLMGQAMNELARVEARALAALPGPMRVDIVETPDEYRLVADLPGVAARDLKVDVGADNVLRIVADKTDAFEQDETRVRIACATRRTPGTLP